MIANSSPITTFKELMDWISYDWESHYSLTKTTDGNFVINKLYITPTHVIYKTECSELSDGLFQKVEALFCLLNDTEE